MTAQPHDNDRDARSKVRAMYDLMTPAERGAFLRAHNTRGGSRVTDEMVKRAATQMRNECGPFFAPQQIAGLFDWEVAARNALAAAFDEEQKPHA